MSVIVFNTVENAMYADTNTTLGSSSIYDTEKVMYHAFHNGWKLLMGRIGTPAIYQPAELYVIRYLEKLALNEDYSLEDLDGGTSLPIDDKLLSLHMQMLDGFRNLAGDDADFSFLIALTDGETTVLGVMHATLGIVWGVKPLNGRRDFVMGSQLVTAAYNAGEEQGGTTEATTAMRLASISNIQFIGVRENRFKRYTFDGGWEWVRP